MKSNKLLKNKLPSLLFSIARLVFLIAFSYIILYPLLYVIVHAFQAPIDYNDVTVQWIPKNYTLENLKEGLKATDFFNGLKNTVFVQVVCALIQVATCGIAAYGLSRFKFKGQGVAIAILFLNILVPTTMLIIPNYINFYNVDFLGIMGLIESFTGMDLTPNLLNTSWVFFLPSIFGVGLQSGLLIYIFMQFFKSFPKELEEASWIDGLTPFGSFLKIVVPSSGVVILTVTIFSVVWHWNEYYLPSMYLSTNYPLAVTMHDVFNIIALANFNITTPEVINRAMAALLIFIVPMLVMFLILQKKFIRSIAQSGIVG